MPTISSAHKTLVHYPDEKSRVITLYVRPLEGQIIAHGWEIKRVAPGERDGSGGPIGYEILGRTPDTRGRFGVAGLTLTLTGRERELMTLAAHGLSNDQIAERLFLSPLMVKTHINCAMMKLAVRDRAQLVVLAYLTGLVRPRRQHRLARWDGARGWSINGAERSRRLATGGKSPVRVPGATGVSLYRWSRQGAQMDALDEALRARIDELAVSEKGRQPILSTTGTQVAIAELIARNDRLERIVGELSLEIEALAASQRARAAADDAAASDR